MVKECIRGLIFVLEMLLLKELALSKFILSPKQKLISAKSSKIRDDMEVENK